MWLSRAAREVLAHISRTGVRVLPARRVGQPRSIHWFDCFWQSVRVEVGLPDVRLLDLQHTYATFALKQGKSVLAIGRLLGHSDPQTTLKYTHMADKLVRDSAETVGTLRGS